MVELANLSAKKRQVLLGQLEKLATLYDVILIDTAAGVDGSVLDFVVSSDFVVVVTTPENTAVTDAYALIKLAIERNPLCEIGVIANRARSKREGLSTIDRLINCAHRFLRRDIRNLGCIWESSHVRRAVNERVPCSIRYPDSRAAISIRKLSRLLVSEGIASPRPRTEQAVFSFVAERWAPREAGLAGR